MAKKQKKAKPKQKDLPGMEERRIPELHAAAEEYAEHRDERMEALQEEVKLKEKLIALMHKHGKTEYAFGEVEIKLVTEKEKVKVKILGKEEKGADAEEE